MEFFLHLLISIAYILPTALGYNLVFGKGKILHFGPYAVALATGYSLYLTWIGSGSFLLGLLAGIGMAGALSALFAWLSLRLEADGLGVMTIAAHLIVIAVILNWNSVTRGALGIPGISRLSFMEDTEMFALISVLTAGCSIAFFAWVHRSKIGRQLSALAEHDWHAQALGVHRPKVHFVAFLLLGLTHVHHNVFFVQYVRFLHPNDYHFPALIFLIMTVVAGGPGSVRGVSIAAITLVLLKESLRFLPIAAEFKGPLLLLLFGMILFAAVWWRRETVFPNQRKI